MTDRQRQAANLAIKGLSNKAIAAEMNIKTKTVQDYLLRVYKHLNVGGRVQMIIRYFPEGGVP